MQNEENKRPAQQRTRTPFHRRTPASVRPGQHEHSREKISPVSAVKKPGAEKTGRSFGAKRKGGVDRRKSAPSGNRPIPQSSAGTSRGKRDTFPEVKEGVVRIIPLGGVEEVGKNMTVFETKDDIFIVDIGLQFRDEETPGIDYILPNTKYLEERKEKIRAVFITHGHLDHIGGISFIMPKIGNPPIYARNLTAILVQKRQLEFPHFPALDIRVVEKNDRIKIGQTYVEFFAVSHSIPDSMGVSIETPYGAIVHTGDLRVDNVNGLPTEEEEAEFARFKNKPPLVLLADSTNADSPGFSLAERIVMKNIEDIIVATSGRLVIGTFASQLERIIKIIHLCEKYGKKVVIEGRSMKVNVEVAKEVGLLNVHKDTLISAEQMESIPPSKIVAIVTGSQGEEFAALMRMANKTHKYFKINKNDTVLLSSSIIPGNEMGVQKIKDNLSRQGAKIIHYKISEVHASGHANGDELGWIHSRVGEKFFIPVHGFHYKLRSHADIAVLNGVKEENIVIPDNGTIIEIEQGEKIRTLPEKAVSGLVLVDGFSMGDMQEVVIRDRQMLAQDGMFIVVAIIDIRTGKLRKSPDILSRGFVYLRENQDLLRQSRFIIKKTIEDSVGGMNPINFDYVKNIVVDNVGRYLFQQTAKRPIVLPVILGV
jgi:ribonuclease J